VWPTTVNGQSLSGSTGTMETQLPSIQVSKIVTLNKKQGSQFSMTHIVCEVNYLSSAWYSYIYSELSPPNERSMQRNSFLRCS
jgi:hypothetical protein